MPTKFEPQKHHRRSIRLQGYDYSQAGAYFVTIVTVGRECLFGEIVDGEIVLNEWGKIVQKWWDDIPNHFPDVETGAFIIMPNHVHGIIIIIEPIIGRGAVPAPNIGDEMVRGGETLGGKTLGGKTLGGKTPPLQWAKKPTLGQIVAYFKYKSTKEINALNGTGVVTKIWQRNYYERIIRNNREMDAIWRYIEANPVNWAQDNENPITP
jgi:REP element-mobilizing transposase RayT